ncbi:flagellar transcriptional activator FlhC [Paraburkholderia caballeronis]|uniref:flagellar transcriptional regulator FlhC n=1 Tax=Paraburkholderia caballeronis TaxID=416943 RepID=UPI00106564AE|nr:flagellar transcriptional regulator FlhC [Paraburkholderia caballeronis]TDV27976.1 flagellar transcriptional activator FlhC [Paraburkholderia caballeronis]
MATRSVVLEVRQIALATELISLGARLPLLEAETSLSRDRLTRLYKEVRGESPPKGMLPFSADWFMSWQANAHSSLFYNIFRVIRGHDGAPIQSIVKSYRLYLEHVQLHAVEPVLSITRAWTLVRYFAAGLLEGVACTRCGGHFVAHAHDPKSGFVCGLCRPPARAGKRGRRAGAARETGLPERDDAPARG